MDQSKISKAKSEEKVFSSQIYEQLSILSKYYGSSNELKKCLSEDMFVKPNPQAFFHVMHFIFNLYDPIEFKKRFFWPIVDKKSESTFRTATIDYINYLNEKHNLQWSNIKTYLVVMPGGMKFITFLYDLLCFVAKELKKKAERLVSDEDKEQFKGDPWVQIARLKHRSMAFKELGSQYIEQVDSLKSVVRTYSNDLRTELNDLAKLVNLTIEDLNDNFFEQFEKSNQDLYEQYLAEQAKMQECSQDQIEPCKMALKSLETYKCGKLYNENNVKKFLMEHGIKKPKNSSQIASLNEFSLDELIKGFDMIAPNIQQYFDCLKENVHMDDGIAEKLEENQLSAESIQSECHEYMQKMKNLEKVLEKNKTPKKKFLSKLCEQRIADKFVSTPPIKLDIPACSRDAIIRLPLQGDSNDQQLNNFSALQTPSRKLRKADCSFDPNMSASNSTLQKSKIIDPMQLLRTISKDKTSSSLRNANISTLSSKWKQNQNYLLGDSQNMTSNTLVQSSCNPFSSNIDTTKIECATSLKGDVDTTTTPQFNDSNLKQPRMSALQKVQNDSQLKNLNSSPSGRLEALVPGPGNGFILPEIIITSDSFVNIEQQLCNPNISFETNESEEIKSNKDIHIQPETPEKRFNEPELQKDGGENRAFLQQLEDNKKIHDDEEKAEAVRVECISSLNLFDSLEEDLVNTSDTVLQDVIM